MRLWGLLNLTDMCVSCETNGTTEYVEEEQRRQLDRYVEPGRPLSPTAGCGEGGGGGRSWREEEREGAVWGFWVAKDTGKRESAIL